MFASGARQYYGFEHPHMSYLAWKLLHIAAVVLFLGNITTGLFWAARARASGDRGQIAATFNSIIASDRWFTMPGVIAIIVSGVAMASISRTPLLSTGWVLWPLVLFAISGIIFSVKIAPLQRRIAALNNNPKDVDKQLDNFEDLFRPWEWWGIAALLTPIAALVIMVLKPGLPSL